MLRTIETTRTDNLSLRLVGIAFFTLLTALAAKMTIEIGPVPFTMQPLVVLLAGMVLGARDGAASLLAYVMLIATGLPLDARSLGTVALFGPTGGYLVGFVAAAFVAGLLVERSQDRLWQRWLAGIAGIAVIYLFGAAHLLLYTGMDVSAAWTTGVAPFILPDLVKALLAAGLVETTRALLLNRQD